MNKVILMGRLTAEPEIRKTASGVSVLSFTLAVDRRFKKEGAQSADFIACVAWRQTAEFIAKYFKKGQRLAVSGAIEVRKWQDRDGNNRYTTEVIADEAYFADGAKIDTASDGDEFTDPSEEEYGELPF